MSLNFADPREMQSKLVADLSSMFAREVPLYDKSLAVNLLCNRAVCDMLSAKFDGFVLDDDDLAATSSERHGAIRVGRDDEYRWVSRFFACFAMEPHNFYDMTRVGAKSQPVIATAFRSTIAPGNRMFASLLRTDYFDAATQARIDRLLDTRQVFSIDAMRLIERHESAGGLTHQEADALIAEATSRIFRWSGEARGRALYNELCAAGFKIAADIACFPSHHLNHLTPNTLCIDLYVAAMRWRLGEMSRERFVARAKRLLSRLAEFADSDWLALHFRQLALDQTRSYMIFDIADTDIHTVCQQLTECLDDPSLDLAATGHNGFKDSTEGPDASTPVLLRQDAYRALTEPVRFVDETPHGHSTHTARFGEIEQRFYATTPEGRAYYDTALTRAAENQPSAQQHPAETGIYPSKTEEEIYAECFSNLPKTLDALVDQDLVYAEYEPSSAFDAAAVDATTDTDLAELVRIGAFQRRGLRYEDFLPVSAAGIFASNLDQYGTDSSAEVKPSYSREQLESIIGRCIIDADLVYKGQQAASILRSLASLGIADRLEAAERRQLMTDAELIPTSSGTALAGV